MEPRIIFGESVSRQSMFPEIQFRNSYIPIFSNLDRDVRLLINRDSRECTYFYDILTPFYEELKSYITIEVVTKYARFLIPINIKLLEEQIISGENMNNIINAVRSRNAYSINLAERYNFVPKVTISSTKEGNINFRVGNTSFITPLCPQVESILGRLQIYMQKYIIPEREEKREIMRRQLQLVTELLESKRSLKK